LEKTIRQNSEETKVRRIYWREEKKGAIGRRDCV
jgi:hypothetical protein